MILLEDVLAGAARSHPRTAGQVFNREFESFSHDSRNIRGGEMFVAVRTERADGHDFILDACRRGAAGVLCERPPSEADLTPLGATCVLVEDTRAALQQWARYVLGKQGLTTVAVTGSVGKTCATRAIAILLRRLGGDPRAVFDNDNFNDLFGLPISLSRLEPAHQVAVLELATDSAGEIAALCDIVSPQMVVVTNVAPVGLRHFGTLERLAAEYAAATHAASDHLFLNADDPLVLPMLGTGAGRQGANAGGSQVTLFGQSRQADVRASDVRVDAGGSRFTLHWQGGAGPVQLPLLGRHSVHTALAAAAVALAAGHDLQEVTDALATLEAPPGRLRPLAGAKSARLLDDTCSASLPSALAAIETLAHQPAPRVFALGDVDGAGAADYRHFGQRVASAAEYLLVVGDAAEPAGQAATSAGMPSAHVAVTHTVEDSVARILSWLPDAPTTNTGQAPATVLVKGAESARLERVVERLLADPETQREQLVRQAPGARQVVPLQLDRAAWMEVDLGAIAGNLGKLREIAAPADVMAVLKADAYGHGAVRVARTAIHHGAAMLGTAVLSEAATLRTHGITAPILVLGYTPPWQARDVARLDVAVSLFSLDLAQHLSRAALALQHPPVPVHLKVDTGMHRLGLLPEDVVPLAREVAALPGVRIDGLFTHFATADDADPAYARRQIERFKRLLQQWQDAGLPLPPHVHAANSAATLRFPDSHFTLVRTGIALYGLHPSQDVPCPADFRPALALKTQLAQVKELPPGEPVSYGATWVTARPSRIGVLPIGYADGFRRAPQHWGDVLVRGQRAPVVGRVCMDMCIVDVTDVPGARAGDEVVLIGTQGGQFITAEDVAARLGTINYEVVSQILARVPREIVSR